MNLASSRCADACVWNAAHAPVPESGRQPMHQHMVWNAANAHAHGSGVQLMHRCTGLGCSPSTHARVCQTSHAPVHGPGRHPMHPCPGPEDSPCNRACVWQAAHAWKRGGYVFFHHYKTHTFPSAAPLLTPPCFLSARCCCADSCAGARCFPDCWKLPPPGDPVPGAPLTCDGAAPAPWWKSGGMRPWVRPVVGLGSICRGGVA
eukprot:356703-Chlamydomonas_euryale.AAC.2